MENKTYIAIDLKSFYASVECIERGLDPLRDCLVVADASRTDKTICLAVTPALKYYDIPGRPRLFEVKQRVDFVNSNRRTRAPNHQFTGSTVYAPKLMTHPELALDFVIAPPRMAYYMEYSTRIYNVYLKYAAPEDIHVYSIDEVFIDATKYLMGRTPREFATEIMKDVLKTTGITATAGIGPNLYLAKVAMDIIAKHCPIDRLGMRIAELDEMSYRRELWDHRPLTDFWRVGRAYAKKLEANGMFTMGDVARCSIGGENDFYNEALLYKLFGVNAELLIDHAWGWEPCTIADIKAYKPSSNSLGSGQVLHCPYPADRARLIVREMADLLVYDLVEKHLVTNQLVLTVGYDKDNLTDPTRGYRGEVKTDFYGRKIPRHAHGSINLNGYTSSTKEIIQAITVLYDRIVDPTLLVRRVNITANHVVDEALAPKSEPAGQLDLFTDYDELERQREQEAETREKEKRMQEAMLNIKKKYGNNAIFKGMNMEEGATALERNRQIGGHKA